MMRLGLRKAWCCIAYYAVLYGPFSPLSPLGWWLLPYAGEYAHWEFRKP